MKKQLLIFSLLPIIATAQNNEGYIIKGKIAGAPDGEVFLLKTDGSDTLNRGKITSGIFYMEKGGEFIGEETILMAGSKKIISNLFIEPGIINVTGEYSDPGTVKATGTPSNDAWNEYQARTIPFEKLRKEIQAAIRTEKDPEKLKKYLEERTLFDKNFYDFRREFAKEYNNTIVAAKFLSAGIGNLDYKGMCDQIDLLDPDAPENTFSVRMKQRREILSRCDYGMPAPDFTLKDPYGKKISLSSFRGKVVLVDFWASWCGYCREENKYIAENLYEVYHPKGFEVISISIDEDREKWIKAIEKDNLPWKNHVSSLVGCECPIARQYGMACGMTGIPYSILVDSNGKVCGYNLRSETLKAKLIEIFGE